MLVFMIRGVFTNLKFVLAQFPTNGVTGDTLSNCVGSIRNIECGLKVIVVTADGASPNRNFSKCIKPLKNLVRLYTRPLIHTASTAVISTLYQMYHI